MIVFHVGLQRLWSHYVKYTYNTHHPFHGQFILHMPNDTHDTMYVCVCAGNMMMHTQCLICAKVLCAHSIRLAEWMPCRTMYMKVNHFLLCSLFANNTPNAAVWSFYYFVSLVLCFLLSAPSSAFCSVRARTILSWIALRMDTLLDLYVCAMCMMFVLLSFVSRLHLFPRFVFATMCKCCIFCWSSFWPNACFLSISSFELNQRVSARIHASDSFAHHSPLALLNLPLHCYTIQMKRLPMSIQLLVCHSSC